MEIFCIILGIFLSYTILYFVIKAAVRNGILEAKSDGKEEDDDGIDKIAQKKCKSCEKSHDIDYPKCPHCGYSDESD